MKETFRALRRSVSAFLLLAAAAPCLPAAEGPVVMDPVVVTATRIEEKVSEQASAVSVVERDDIELRVPALAGDVLPGLPGVDVQRTGSMGNIESIRLRGGQATGTLVLIDGFPVNSPSLGLFDIGSLPAARFERVEVVRGAQSALYGSNAMSGVVNFLPPAPKEGARHGGGIAAGSFTTLQWNAFTERGGKGGSYHLGGAGFRTDGIMENDDGNLASFLGGGEVPVGEKSRAHFLVLGTDLEKGIPVDFGNTNDDDHRSTRRGILAGGRLESRLSQALEITASASVHDERSLQKDAADPEDLFPFSFTSDTRTRKSVFGLMARVIGGERSDTFVGVEYTRDRLTGKDQDSFSGASSSFGKTINRSAFLQQEWRPVKGTGLSAGVRVDRNTEAGTEVNPRLAAYREIGTTGVRLRAAAGRGFRTPTVDEKTDPSVGNPDLRPARSFSWEAGADAVLAGGDALVSATWFYQSFRDLIEFDGTLGTGPQGFGQMLNKGRAFSRGVEASAAWNLLKNVAAELAYTFTDTWEALGGRRILAVPTHRGSVSLVCTPAAGLTLRGDWRIEDDMLDAPPNGEDPRRPGYSRVDLFGRYRWRTQDPESGEIALVGKVSNLLDRRYEERRGHPSPGIGVLLGMEVVL
ncbi:MAG: TonB-dependent receptor [Thermodesulfobacteriota bacterium]